MSPKHYALRNIEETESEGDVLEGRRDPPLKKGQILALHFLDPRGGPGEIMDVVTLERCSDDAYGGELLSSPTVVELAHGDRVEFGPEHIVEFFEGRLPIGAQELSHYEDKITLGDSEVAPDELARLRFFPLLRELDLRNTPVADLSFLRETRGLRVLNVDDTKVSNLAPLADLGELNTLFAARTDVEDLRGLEAVLSLEGLRLTDTAVSDLGPIGGLRSLRYLNVGISKVKAMPLLEGLPSLHVLDISCTLVSELSWISRCTSLRKLNALMCELDSLEPLGSARELRRLTLSVVPTADFSALWPLKELVYVGIHIARGERVDPAQRKALDELASRGVDVVCSERVDELVDLLSPVVH